MDSLAAKKGKLGGHLIDIQPSSQTFFKVGGGERKDKPHFLHHVAAAFTQVHPLNID
jgi:hypothetical protein